MKFKKKITDSNILFNESIENNNDLSVITIESIFNKVKEHKSFLLAQDIKRNIRFVSFKNGTLFVNKEENSSQNIINNMNIFFEEHNIDIKVQLSPELGEPTLEQQEKMLFQKQIEEISKQPIMKEFFNSFKNYSVEKIEKI